MLTSNDHDIPEKKVEMEKELERCGWLTKLQEYRLKTTDESMKIPLYLFLHAELRLREAVQREMALKKMKTDGKDKQSQERRTELLAMRELYWFYERRRWKYRYECAGPVRRALELWRSHPQWYLHRTIVERCVARGGCCGYSCGCCINRKIPEERKLGIGHCTHECECCKARAPIGLSHMGVKDDVYSVDLRLSNPYSDALSRASLWGLSPDGLFSGDKKSPFELIRERKYRPAFGLKTGRMFIGFKAVYRAEEMPFPRPPSMNKEEIITICFAIFSILLMCGAYLV